MEAQVHHETKRETEFLDQLQHALETGEGVEELLYIDSERHELDTAYELAGMLVDELRRVAQSQPSGSDERLDTGSCWTMALGAYSLIGKVRRS